MRPFSSTTTETFNRTRGRMSATRWPSPRRIWTAYQRIFLAIETPIGAGRRFGQRPAMAGVDGLHRFGGACHGRLAQLAGMGKSCRLARDRPQAEALCRVEAGAFQLAVVEAQGLRLAVFQEHLAIIGALQGVGGQALDAAAVEPGLGEKQIVGLGEGIHVEHSISACLSDHIGSPRSLRPSVASFAGSLYD